MNNFYDISDKQVNLDNSLQLENLGAKNLFITIVNSSRNSDGRRSVKDIHTDVKPEDYDGLFASRISRIKPPYEMGKFLDHHFGHYLKRFPRQKETFFKHMKYVIVPILKRDRHDIYVDLLQEWIEEKKTQLELNQLGINERLDKILRFLAANPARNDVTACTIHEEIFKESITFQEAQELYHKIHVSGKVRVIGHAYLAHSNETDIFLQNGGFSRRKNEIETLIQTQHITMGSKKDTQEPGEVFISYSWDNGEHENKVGSLTNYLRENGFIAQMDKMLSQQETATNFIKMMHLAMRQHPKVIVVLSEGYKLKADNFQGGVGEEFQLIINDINANPKKYILVSFEGRSAEIIPFSLQGRDILDLSREGSDEKLFRKLLDQDEFQFEEVAPKKPKLQPKQFGKFRENVPLAKAGDSPIDQPQEPIRIIRVVAEEVTTPNNDGSTGSALYVIPFELNRHPDWQWTELFIACWDRPPRFTTMHRPGIASVRGNRIILDGTNIEEVERYHRDTLKLAVDEANKRYAKTRELKQREEDLRKQNENQHRKNIEDIGKRLNFD